MWNALLAVRWTVRWRESRHRERAHRRLVTDGGEPDESADDGDDTTTDGDVDGAGDGDDTTSERDDDGGADGESEGASSERADESGDGSGGGVDRSNVEITDAGETDPADPKWQKPDPEDIPEFEVRATDPVTTGGTGIGDEAATPDAAESSDPPDDPGDPTAGMPNNARSPGATRISADGTEAYVVAVELCARLPEDVRLPEEAADLVPAAVEAELEQDIKQFAAAEFGTQRPHVDTLSFEDVDGEIWLRLRIGLPADSFEDLDPEAVRSYALEQLEGVL